MSKIYKIDGSIIDNLLFTPEAYGAVGDGIADDTQAVQSAINNKYVSCMSGKTYKITSKLRIKEGGFINLNGSTFLCAGTHLLFNFDDGDSYSGYNGNGNITICNGTIIGGCISFIHGKHIRLFNLHFRNALNDHFMEICACKDYIISDCSFVGMAYRENAALEYINIDTNASYSAFPHNKSGQNDPVFYDMSTNEDIVVRNCYFALGEDTYAFGFDAVGVHSRNVSATYAKNVVIDNNQIVGFTGCGIRINAMDGAYVCNNNIQTVGDGIRIGDVADTKNVVIKGNYVVSSEGDKLVRTSGQYTNLTVSDNVTEGDSQQF